MVESAVLTATSNRELAATMIASAQTLVKTLDITTGVIATFTEKADKGTNRLIVATYVLSAAALIAAGIGFYATRSAPAPEVHIIGVPVPQSRQSSAYEYPRRGRTAPSLHRSRPPVPRPSARARASEGAI
jgi:hypothetical protein